jgi:hypothetical protein
VVTIPLAPWRTDPGPIGDEGLLLAEPELVLDGKLPYRDFGTFYGPATSMLPAAVYAVTEPRVGIERAIGLAYRLALVAAVFALALRTGLATAVAAGLISGGLLFVQVFAIFPLAALGWFGGLALAAWSLWFLQRALAREPVNATAIPWAGLAAGLAISFRPQLGLAVALAAVPLLGGRPLALSRRLVLWTLAGALPLLGVVVLAGPAPVFRSIVIDALFRSAPQSTLPYPTTSPALELGILLLVGTGVLVIGLVAAIRASWRRGSRGPEERRLASLALFGLALVPQVLGRASIHDTAKVGVVVIALMPTVLASPRIAGALRAPLRQGIAVGLSGLAVLLGAGSYINIAGDGFERAFGDPAEYEERDQRLNWVHWGSRSFPLYSAAQVEETRAALEEIDRISAPGDRLLVGPPNLRRTYYADAHLYHLLPELEVGTYHVEMAPGVANREGSGLAEDVAAADVVVLGTSVDWRIVAPNVKLGTDDAATRALRAHFCIAARVPPYKIYDRCP